ncbi:uncharacterized protein N7473_004465 [Penicillium subrubescens]|uniref:uncharacterized protein n=1 Tax=Penicillium subrubescens TaxID=1316194 RepID=UPI00254525B6|nr:uncharacterized protein N7473_004465 [Penicillium subrubescens]KAJ5900395.1 hypothetical protein N7473_004465 [Penicillium subrubescens]
MQPNNPPNNVVGELDPNKTLQVEPAHHQNQSGCGKTVFFGVSSSYVPDWDTRAAFRELYQNWRDAILARSNLGRLDFQPFYEDRGDCVAIIVPDLSDRHRQGRALGFIKYNKHSGCVTISNSCAELGLNALELGSSSKQHNSNSAGCHREGLKLAALVIVRSGFEVELSASRRY